jgi:hypothetical protein
MDTILATPRNYYEGTMVRIQYPRCHAKNCVDWVVVREDVLNAVRL